MFIEMENVFVWGYKVKNLMEEAETNLALKKLQPLWIALLPELSSLFGNSP